MAERWPRAGCSVCGRDVALTPKRRLVGAHRGSAGARCEGTGLPASGLVRLRDAAEIRDGRRRVALAERLAEVQVQADAIAKSAVELASVTFPAMLEALELVVAKPESGDARALVREPIVGAD